MNWTKTPPTKPGAYWWKAQTGAIKCCDVFTDRDGNLIAQGFGVSDDVYLLRGEWAELVPAEELQKAQADAAAMREALEDFKTECRDCGGAGWYAVGQDAPEQVQCQRCHGVQFALSTNAGRDYVHRSEVEKAWKECAMHDKASPYTDWLNSRARKVATGKAVT